MNIDNENQLSEKSVGKNVMNTIMNMIMTITYLRCIVITMDHQEGW